MAAASTATSFDWLLYQFLAKHFARGAERLYRRRRTGMAFTRFVPAGRHGGQQGTAACAQPWAFGKTGTATVLARQGVFQRNDSGVLTTRQHTGPSVQTQASGLCLHRLGQG